VPYNKMSSCTERRRAQRGAIFVEAVIVISTLTLCLLGLCYVRDLYVRQLGVSRLARAAVIAHSMAGCKGELARDWLREDVGRYELHEPNQEQQAAHGKDSAAAPAAAPAGSHAGGLLQRAGGTSSDGKGVLNPITDAELSGQARASDRPLLNGGRAELFSGKVRARSYVSCGDEVKDGDFDRIFGVLKDDIGNLLSF
jgi:hypothetical protein